MNILLRAGIVLALAIGLADCAPKDRDGPDREVRVSVSAAKVVRGDIGAWVAAYGTVDASPDHAGQAAAAHLAASFDSLVLDVPVREGQHVRAGDVVVRLDDRAAAAAVRGAEASLAAARAEADRQKGLETLGGVSRRSLDEAEQRAAAAAAALAAARAQLAQTRLPSPISGVMAGLHVLPGQSVAPGAVIADIVAGDRLVATVAAPAEDARAIRPGQTAQVQTRWASAPIPAEVRFVSPQVDPATGSVMIRLGIPAGAGLRYGEFVRAQIQTEVRAGRLIVPEAAVYTDHDGRSSLAVVHGDVADQLEVKVGLRSGGLVEVEAPALRAGDRVVTAGAYALRDRTKVSVTATDAAQPGRRAGA